MITCVETLSRFVSIFFSDLHKKLLGLSTTWWVGCLLLNMRSQRGNLPMDAVWGGRDGKRPHYYSFSFCKEKEKRDKEIKKKRGGWWLKQLFET